RVQEQEEILLSLRKKLGYGVIAADQRLYSTRNMSVGQKVTLVVPGPGGGQKPHSIGAMVSHVGEFWFTARIVEDFGGLVSVGGWEIRLAFLREGDAAYSVSARVRDAEAAGLINFFHTMKLLRNQHRQYMRLDINMPIKYKVIERIDSEERAFTDEFAAHTIDISGGGVCFIADVPLAAGDTILLTLSIPGATLSGIRSKILKVLPVEGKGAATRYRHLVQFVLIEQQQRDKIVKFIFEKQRTLLQMR
ncbi:MAG: PilZ domain-containing protein, partial [Chitinispirillales bacterium]|nr:PilZ domain-containing protein [Chitinispirillales bacterium]